MDAADRRSLGEVTASVRAQTYRAIEIIAVDDASREPSGSGSTENGVSASVRFSTLPSTVSCVAVTS